MHRPVLTPGFGELASPVERIDDPDPLRAQPRGVIEALLGQHCIVGPRFGQPIHQIPVRKTVALGFAFGGVRVGEIVAHP